MTRVFCWVIISLFFCFVQSQFINSTGVKYPIQSEVLSRRKRFLIFPEGSSLQLVFCISFPTIFAIGDIFLWGYTAALAWELPQDPYSPFDHHADPLHRRHDTKTIYYTSDEGKIIYKRQYSRPKKLIVNPAFAKRSVDEIKKATQKIGMDRKQMHASKNKREFLNEPLSRRAVEFHRSARVDLYQKIEIMLNGLGTDGKQCLLKTLCLVSKTQQDPQGSFLQEILRATFTLPKALSQDDLMEYDEASSSEESCEKLYSDCEQPVTDLVLRS